MKIWSLSTDLESCSINRKQLQELVVSSACCQFENKQSEAAYWENLDEERAKTITDRKASITQWKNYCDTITAEEKRSPYWL